MAEKELTGIGLILEFYTPHEEGTTPHSAPYKALIQQKIRPPPPPHSHGLPPQQGFQSHQILQFDAATGHQLLTPCLDQCFSRTEPFRRGRDDFPLF